MRPIAAIDCETDPFKYRQEIKPFIWGGVFKGEFRHYKTFRELLKWLEDKNEKLVAYAHNGGRFDFIFKDVVECIPNGTMLQIIHGRLARFRIGNIEFRDSLCAVPVGLAKYKKSDMAYWKLRAEHRKKYRDEIIKYLESDCVNLYDLMATFIELYGPSLTLAGASMKQASKIEEFDVPKSTPAYFRDLKPFYFGGRVQAFTKGKAKGPIKLWDINSAYPDAMKKKHPWGARYHLSEYTGGKVPDTACVEINCQALGVFPWGGKKGTTAFPDDGERYDFKITGWEYNEAKRLGMLGVKPRIDRLYTFPESRSYAKYVDHFYKIRMESPEGSAERVFGKLFMNSFYGRTGMDGSAYEQYMIDSPKAAKRLSEDGWMMREETEDGRWIYFRPEPKDKWRFHDVAIAISVTGCVRAKLMRNIVEARAQGCKVHYCDTDGLQAGDGWEPKDQGDKLGAWKREKCEKCGTINFVVGYYAGKKLYSVKCENGHWKKAHKGVVLTGKQISRIAEFGEEIVYKKAAPSMGILSGSHFVKRKVRRTN